MTLDEFQSNKSLKEEAAKSPIVQTLITVLESEVLKKQCRIGRTAGFKPEDKIEVLGHMQGFSEAIATLNLCRSEPRPMPKEIPSTYQPANPPVQTVVPQRKRESQI